MPLSVRVEVWTVCLVVKTLHVREHAQGFFMLIPLV
jgi:hypothetical protein